MKAITIKAMFDRKGEADNKKKKGLVQRRVTYDRKQVFYTTGIKVFKYQWDGAKERVRNSMQAISYNKVIDAYINAILSYQDKCIRGEETFDFERL